MPDALITELKMEQANGRRLREELQTARQTPDPAEVTSALLGQAADLAELLLTQEVAKSRQVLRRLGVRLEVGVPDRCPEGRVFPLTLKGYAGLLGKGILGSLGTGPEPEVGWFIDPNEIGRPRPIAGGSKSVVVPSDGVPSDASPPRVAPAKPALGAHCSRPREAPTRDSVRHGVRAQYDFGSPRTRSAR